MKVNGNFMVLNQPQSLFDFLQEQKYETSRVAVERNGEIVPRATYKDVILHDQDTLEIVSFVGGG